MRRCKLFESFVLFLFLTVVVVASLLPTLVHTQNAASAPAPATATLIVKTVDGNLHYVKLGDQLDRLSRLWSINLGELITSNLEDVKVEYGNVANLYRIIPSLEGSLYKYSFSLIKNEPTAAIDGLVIENDSGSGEVDREYLVNDIEDDDDDDDDEMDADTGTYYPHSKSKDSSKHQHQRPSSSYHSRDNESSDDSTGQRRKPSVSIYNQVYEKIPFDMDDLLKSTFLFNNDLTFTGSIHSNLIRVDHIHGQLIQPNGKSQTTDEQNSEGSKIIQDDQDGASSTPSSPTPTNHADNVFIIKQTRYDLKAISIKNGTEKWNLNLAKNEIIKYPKQLVIGNSGDDQSDCFVPKSKHEQQMASIEGLLEFDVATGRIWIDKQAQGVHGQDRQIIMDVLETRNNESTVLDLKAPIVGCELIYKGIAKHVNIFAQKKTSSSNSAGNKYPIKHLINTSTKHRASKSTTTGDGYDFMGPSVTAHDNHSKQGKSTRTKKDNAAAVAQAYPWSRSVVAAKDGTYSSRRNTIDLSVIYIGVYKDKFYAQNRYDPVYERYIHLKQIYDDGSPEFNRCSRPQNLEGQTEHDLKLITEETDYDYEDNSQALDTDAASNQLSVVVGGDRKRDKIFAFLEKLKTRASSLLSYGKMCRLLSTYFFEDHSNCNNLEYFEDDSRCPFDHENEGASADQHSSAKYELSRTQEERCDVKKSGSKAKKSRQTNSSQIQENASNNDLRTILIIVVTTSIISISFATFIFIKFNKRINGILFFKDQPAEVMNASAFSKGGLDDSLNKSPGPITPKNKSSQHGDMFFSDVSGDSAASGEQGGGQRSRKSSSSGCSNCSGCAGSRNSVFWIQNNNNNNCLYSENGESRSKKCRMKSSVSENAISSYYREGSPPPPALDMKQVSNKSANASVLTGHGNNNEQTMHSKSLANVLKGNETPFICQPTSPKGEETSQMMPRSLAEMNDEELLSCYESKYLDEFKHIRLIGKGGFGYVFEAMHKIDERIFAIKRVKLKNSQDAKDRVLREVKILANLESPYIVRYFYSWIERPPAAWQTLVDKRILLSKNISIADGHTIELNDTFNNTQFSIESNETTEDNSCDISSSFSSLSSSVQLMNESTRMSHDFSNVSRRPSTLGAQDSSDKILNLMDLRGYNDDSLKLHHSTKPHKKSIKRFRSATAKIDFSSASDQNMATTWDSEESVSCPSIEFQRSDTDEQEMVDQLDTKQQSANSLSDDDDIVFQRSSSSSSSSTEESTEDDDDDSDSDTDSDDTNDLDVDDFDEETDSSCSIVFKNNDDTVGSESQSSQDHGFVEGSEGSESPKSSANTLKISRSVKEERQRQPKTRRGSLLKKASKSKTVSTTTTDRPPKTEFIYLYIQMELCKRETLRHWLTSNNKRDHKQILNIFEQILNAILYIHSKGLIHRDLKPSNIFLSLDGQTIKIGDFGLVISSEEHLLEDETSNGAVPGSVISPTVLGSISPSIATLNNAGGEAKETPTAASVIKPKQPQFFDGTYLYMSPEQLRRLEYNSKVDIFSLGIILFELIVPFDTAMERIQTLRALNKCRFPDNFEKNYPIEKSLISLLIEPNPDKRLSAEQIQNHQAYLDFKSAYSV